MFYTRLGNKVNLEIIGIGDASFKSDDKAVGEVKLFCLIQV